MSTQPSTVMSTGLETRLNDRVGQASSERQVDAREIPRRSYRRFPPNNSDQREQMTAKLNDATARSKLREPPGEQMTAKLNYATIGSKLHPTKEDKLRRSQIAPAGQKQQSK